MRGEFDVFNLDDTAQMHNLDKENMLALLYNFPQQCRDAYKIGEDFRINSSHFRGIKNIVFAGLGGSAIGADLIRSYIRGEIGVPVEVVRTYTIPNYIDNGTLAFICSYSGNTEETLSAYGLLKKKTRKMIALASGGELIRLAKKDGIPHIVIPAGMPPRCALGFASIPHLVALSKLGLIKDKKSDIMAAADFLERLRGELSCEVKTRHNLAKALANRLRGKFVVIYGASEHTDAAALRWRGQFAENSKVLASSHIFPEMNHNEIVGWQNPQSALKNFVVIILRDRGDHPRIQRRMDITKGILKKVAADVIEVESRGGNLLARIFSLIYIGDYASVYLAFLNETDPTPVDRVTYLKKELAKI